MYICKKKYIYIYIYNILDNKSGTNEHPTRLLDTRICGGEFWAFQLCFYSFKPCNYGLQRRLMSKKVAPPQKKFWSSENRQARNHPSASLGSLGTQKTGSGLSVVQNVDKGDPRGPPQQMLIPIFKNIGSQGFPRFF